MKRIVLLLMLASFVDLSAGIIAPTPSTADSTIYWSPDKGYDGKIKRDANGDRI